MTGTRIHSDVNYYDQLGVSQNATPEQIRHAYRSLVRLLHPDGQTDPELKAAAEKQLRKLNRIHAILIDPVNRQSYDEYLSDEWLPPVDDGEPNVRLRKNLIRGVWITVGLLTVALVFWLGSESSPGPENTPINAIAQGKKPELKTSLPEARKDAGEEAVTLRAELDRALSERDDALREVTQLRQAKKRPLPRLFSAPDTTASSGKQLFSAVPAATEQPAANSAVSLSAPTSSKADTTAAKKLAGFWFYVKPKEGQQNKNKALYPPEFIELTIQEDNGNVKGKYRARYKISDRPIPPDVTFEVTGHEINGNCACSWHGIGGAHGPITLQLKNDHSMRFDWSAAELGSQQGLASGTATLNRRAE